MKGGELVECQDNRFEAYEGAMLRGLLYVQPGPLISCLRDSLAVRTLFLIL